MQKFLNEYMKDHIFFSGIDFTAVRIIIQCLHMQKFHKELIVGEGWEVIGNGHRALISFTTFK